jgi:ubiquinol-cytochrome c reductase cytochrome c1 subunit
MTARIASLVVFVGLALELSLPAAAQEEHEAGLAHYPLLAPTPQTWSFSGVFGVFDTVQLQRGYQVYREVCSGCHSLNYMAFRNLTQKGGPHFSEEDVRALAAQFQVTDGPDATGKMFQRPGQLPDGFPAPFPNPETAAALNGGAAPPDLSMIAEARSVSRGLLASIADFFTTYQEGGPDYIHALLTGYQEAPAGVEVPPGTYYNPYFVNGVSLAMPQLLFDGTVKYADETTPETADQYARDVAAFLAWTAEPHMVDRKRLGFQVIIFLIGFAVLMYLTQRKVWTDVER